MGPSYAGHRLRRRCRSLAPDRAPLCGRYVLVSAATIAALALEFGLTVDQVTNELEAWALCAPATHPPECIHPQCLQRSLAPPFASAAPSSSRTPGRGPAGAGT